MISEEEIISAGETFKPHGYKGEVSAAIDFDLSETDLTPMPFVFKLDGIFVPFFIDTIRKLKNNAWLIKFDGLNSDEEIKLLSKKEFYFRKKQLAEILDVSEAELEEQEEDILGYRVIDSENGQLIGVVTDILEGQEYDYIEVENEEGGNIQIPLIEPFILEIKENENQGEIYVSLPEGFLDLMP